MIAVAETGMDGGDDGNELLHNTYDCPVRYAVAIYWLSR
jgi:hypothetical protein